LRCDVMTKLAPGTLIVVRIVTDYNRDDTTSSKRSQ
jgi:hypothetical protein